MMGVLGYMLVKRASQMVQWHLPHSPLMEQRHILHLRTMLTMANRA